MEFKSSSIAAFCEQTLRPTDAGLPEKQLVIKVSDCQRNYSVNGVHLGVGFAFGALALTQLHPSVAPTDRPVGRVNMSYSLLAVQTAATYNDNNVSIQPRMADSATAKTPQITNMPNIQKMADIVMPLPATDTMHPVLRGIFGSIKDIGHSVTTSKLIENIPGQVMGAVSDQITNVKDLLPSHVFGQDSKNLVLSSPLTGTSSRDTNVATPATVAPGVQAKATALQTQTDSSKTPDLLSQPSLGQPSRPTVLGGVIEQAVKHALIELPPQLISSSFVSVDTKSHTSASSGIDIVMPQAGALAPAEIQPVLLTPGSVAQSPANNSQATASSGLSAAAKRAKVGVVMDDEFKRYGGITDYATLSKHYADGRIEAWCDDTATFIDRTAGFPIQGTAARGVFNNLVPYTPTNVAIFKSMPDVRVYTAAEIRAGAYKPDTGDYIFYKYDSDPKTEVSHVDRVRGRNPDGSVSKLGGNSGDRLRFDGHQSLSDPDIRYVVNRFVGIDAVPSAPGIIAEVTSGFSFVTATIAKFTTPSKGVDIVAPIGDNQDQPKIQEITSAVPPSAVQAPPSFTQVDIANHTTVPGKSVDIALPVVDPPPLISPPSNGNGKNPGELAPPINPTPPVVDPTKQTPPPIDPGTKVVTPAPSGPILYPSDNNDHARELYVMDNLLGHDKTLTPAQAAGWVGNFDVEDPGLDTHGVQDGQGPGRGLAMWGLPGRFDNLIQFAKDTGARDPYDVSVQLDFVRHEDPSMSAVKSTNNPVDAAISVQQTFERPNPAKAHTDRRTASAVTIFDIWSQRHSI